MSWLRISPSEEEIEEGCLTVHVVPNFGREHVLWDLCWCEPKEDFGNPGVLVHEQDH